MADKKQPTGDYEVGHGKPPTHTRFKKGQSGNPKGRPKSGTSGSTNISALLDEPVKVTAHGKACEMSPFEAGLRQRAQRALAGHLPSIIKFVKICEEYGVIAPPPAIRGGGVVVAPKGVNFQEWLNSVTEEVPVDEA